ncbi:MAG: endonuclease [Clostridia bacterium]|nr:endonuclease [Clostridia bacterium]
MGRSIWKTVGKTVLLILMAVLLLAGGLVVYLMATEYRPQAEETVNYTQEATAKLAPGKSFTVLSFNIGYGGLGAESDFFMDGGRDVRPRRKETVQKNLKGIESILGDAEADFYLLQEVDLDAKRSYGINQAALLREGRAVDAAHALNYSCRYVPFPWPPIGRVHSGLYTMSHYVFNGEHTAVRQALPNPFSWPLRIANLKRCLLITRVAIEGTEQELVLVNLHLEAYDDGAGKTAQTAQLMNFLEAEYQKGNYVVAGGDFNCNFPVVDPNVWPILSLDTYVPGTIGNEALPKGFQWAVDAVVPTCRLLNKPLDAPGDNQFYVIDGFILSPNVELMEAHTLDRSFQYSDHNPVLLRARLLP